MVGGGEVPRDDLTKNVVKDEIDEEKYYSAVSFVPTNPHAWRCSHGRED